MPRYQKLYSIELYITIQNDDLYNHNDHQFKQLARRGEGGGAGGFGPSSYKTPPSVTSVIMCYYTNYYTVVGVEFGNWLRIDAHTGQSLKK